MKMEGGNKNGALPLTSLNHISVRCRSVEKSVDFYQNVLGFFPVRRPGSFNFDGAWLFSYGIGIHLLQCEDLKNVPHEREINPKDNHISFQCESMSAVEKRLKEMNIKHIKCRVEEGGIFVDQIFFHDPDGFMIEICNCDILPVIPLVMGEAGVRVCKIGGLVKQQQQKVVEFLPKAVHVKQEPQSITCE